MVFKTQSRNGRKLFYLGSLLGTAVTDGYFYITGLIPYWRSLMIVESEMALEVFQGALTQVRTSWGITWIIFLVGILLFFWSCTFAV